MQTGVMLKIVLRTMLMVLPRWTRLSKFSCLHFVMPGTLILIPTVGEFNVLWPRLSQLTDVNIQLVGPNDIRVNGNVSYIFAGPFAFTPETFLNKTIKWDSENVP